MSVVSISFFALSCLPVAAGVTGRLLVLPSNLPASGASAMWKSTLTSEPITTDIAGGFAISGESLKKIPAVPAGSLDITDARINHRELQLNTHSPNAAVSISLHDLQGRAVYRLSRRFENVGSHALPLPENIASNAVKILRVSANGKSYLFKLGQANGRLMPRESKSVQAGALGREAVEADTLVITMPGYMPLQFPGLPNNADLGELRMFPLPQATPVIPSGNYRTFSHRRYSRK